MVRKQQFTKGNGGQGYVDVKLIDSTGIEKATYRIFTYSTSTTSETPILFEIVAIGSNIYLYQDGVSKGDIGDITSGASYKLQFQMGALTYYNAEPTYTRIWIDDISTGSIIGSDSGFNEMSTAIEYSYAIQAFNSYPDSDFTIDVYSLTAPNAGLISSSEVSSRIGFSSFAPSILGDNYGLYFFELKRDSTVLTDTYFYYYQLSDPQQFPEVLLTAGADVNAEIRDDSNNGGEIAGGGSVYLYPAEIEGGVYNISYDILETPYSIEAEITKIYNTSDLNGTNLLFSGLSSQNYYISVDGTAINGTNGSDTWNYTVTWDTLDSHIISFAPDYTLPGVYGYIKNSETQNAIKSATVAISNGTSTEYLFTDDNGMYYYTRGMVPGSYTVTASKSGYTTSAPYSVTTQNGSTTRQDIFLDPESGSGIYYASHDVTFTVLEYWYSSIGLPGVSYAVYDNENESVKNGTTGSKGTFTVKDMDAGKNYTFILTYNNQTYTESLEPGLTEYTLVLNKEGIVHQYYNSWLNLTYAENSNNATVLYTSNKTVSAAFLSVTASNGTIVQSNTLNTTSGTFTFNFTEGDYILQFDIDASDGSTASQAWSISSPPEVTLFPASYPAWLKNTLFVAIIIIFLLAFGKSKNDIACGSVAVLTSLGYYFEWLTCSFNFVVLIWIIALGAIFLHYKRTGAVG